MELTKNMQIPPKKSRKGFSLAEILLTLTIIGCIAGLIIPPFIQSEQQAQFNAGAQTAYQMVAQAVEGY